MGTPWLCWMLFALRPGVVPSGVLARYQRASKGDVFYRSMADGGGVTQSHPCLAEAKVDHSPFAFRFCGVCLFASLGLAQAMKQLLRDVEVRHDLVDHAEYVKSPIGVSSAPSVSHPTEMSFSPDPQHLGTGRQKALAKPLPAASTQYSVGARGCKAVSAENNMCSSN